MNKNLITLYQNIYSISTDTKVISKIIELMIFPKLLEFANNNGFELKLSPHQNYYPDITFIDNLGKKYAVDLKSTYRTSDSEVNGMTLGAFTGYFRNRLSSKNVLYPYSDYEKHFVFGIIYSRTDITKIENYLKSKSITINQAKKKSIITYINENSDENWNNLQEKVIDTMLDSNDREVINKYLINETNIYTIDSFQEIQSVVGDFEFFIQEKWKIAIDRPGSGNTKNIGSESKIQRLKEGTGLFFREFNENGKAIFDSYWMNYLTKDMAKNEGRDKPPYSNIATYKEWVETLKT